MDKTKEECEKYRRFVDERLKVDLAEVIKRMNVIVDEIKDYEILQISIAKIKSCGIKENLETRVNIGNDFFCEAVVDKTDHVIVKLCDDIFAELTLDRAETFIEKRIDLLNSRVDQLQKEANSIRAQMNLVLSSLDKLNTLEDTK